MKRLVVLAAPWLVATGAAIAGTGGLLGHLTAQDQVSIEAAKGNLELVDASYPYAGGERIVTGPSGHAVLTVSGGAIAVDPTSAATVTAADGGYRVALDAGHVGVTAGTGPEFTILAGGLHAEPVAASDALDVRVGFDRDGRILVENRGRAVRVSDGDRFNQVDRGETWSFAPAGTAGPATGETGLPGAVPIGRAAAVLGPAGAAVGVARIRQSQDDDDDDEDATSPN